MWSWKQIDRPFVAPIHSVFIITEKKDSRWWPWMHRLKRIRNNVHTFERASISLRTWQRLSQTRAFVHIPTGMCNSCTVNGRSYLIIWSRPVDAKQRPRQVFHLIRARESNNVSLALTPGWETTEMRPITRYICNLNLIEHKQAKAAKVNGVKATEMRGHLFCRFRVYSSLTRRGTISSIK